MGEALVLPKLAAVYLPLLLETINVVWPTAPHREFIASQIEQETCATLTHSKCWNPTAELKTSREYGFGLGQITRAFRADGSVRFDKFKELGAAYRSLAGWTWEDRFNPRYQMIALVEMDRGICLGIDSVADSVETVAFCMSAYNGGEGGLMQDRMLCRNTKGCDPSRWWKHVEKTSLKPTAKWEGYGQSAFAINRGYVHNIWNVRRAKYVKVMNGQSEGGRQ